MPYQLFCYSVSMVVKYTQHENNPHHHFSCAVQWIKYVDNVPHPTVHPHHTVSTYIWSSVPITHSLSPPPSSPWKSAFPASGSYCSKYLIQVQSYSICVFVTR